MVRVCVRSGRGWEREVRIAAGLPQDAQLVAYTAMAALGMGIVERPIAVHESVADGARVVA